MRQCHAHGLLFQEYVHDQSDGSANIINTIFIESIYMQYVYLFSGNLILQQGWASSAVIRNSKPLIGVADSYTVIRSQWLLGMRIGRISF